MSMLMLSVSGCRGIVGETLTPEVASRFAGAFGSVLRDRAGGKPCLVVLGRDGRKGCEFVHAGAIAGLLASGCSVQDLGVAMTPTTAVLTDAAGRAGGASVGGMVLTASHNPQQWNGLKCLLAEGGLHGSAACAPPAAIARDVIERFHSGRTHRAAWDQVGSLSGAPGASEAHVDRVQRALEEGGQTTMPSSVAHGVKVAVDCVNASASRTAPLMLRSLGAAEVVEVFCEHSGPRAGLFPHAPEPTAANLGGAGGLCDAVRAHECAVGFALDPDADRLALIDSDGRYVGEEYTLALSAWAVLEGAKRAGAQVQGAALVTNLSTSRMLNDVAGWYGARVVRTPVGEANVVEAMKREGAIMGGEGNGGAIWPRSCYVRDSLSAMGLILWLMSARADGRVRTLKELVAAIPSYAIEKRKVDLSRAEDAPPRVERVAKAFGVMGHSVDTRDGAWVDFAQGPLAGRAWLHVRASNTEPIMRLIAEAPTSAQANGVLDEAMRVMG